MILKELNSLKDVNSIKCSNCYTNFGGTNEMVEVSTSALDAFDYTDPLTISIWVYVSTDGLFPSLISKYVSATPQGFALSVLDSTAGVNAGKVRINLVTNGSNNLDVYSSSSINFNEWTHIAVTLDGTGTRAGTNIYINKVNAGIDVSLGSDTLTSGTIVTGVNLEIGAISDLSRYLEGGMEDLAIFNRELTEGEIQQIYSRGRFGASYADIANLVSFYEMSSINPKDIVGGYDGTSVNMDEGDITCTGLPINCYTTLNGLNEYMRGGTGNPYNFEWNEPFSFSIWLNTPLDATGVVLSKWFNQTGWILLLSLNGSITFQIRTGIFIATRCLNVLTNTGVLTPNVLNHIVLTYDGSGVIGGCKLYINNVNVPFITANPASVTTGTMRSASAFLEFGAATSLGYYQEGGLYDVKIWKKVLTLDEVTQEYNLGDIPNDRPADFPNLVAWNRCGEEIYYTASTPIFEDSSGAGADFTGINIDSTNIKCE